MRRLYKKLMSSVLLLVFLLNLLPTAAATTGTCTKTEGCQLAADHSGFCKNGNTFTVYEYEQFKAAIKSINDASDGAFVISLGADITDLSGSSNTDLSFTKNTTTILGNGHTMHMDGGTAHISASGPDTVVNFGASDGSDTLVIDGNYTDVANYTGVANRTMSLVHVTQGAVLNMYNGVTICRSNVGGQAGGVQLADNSKFNMYGGTITKCINSASVSGGVVAYGSSTFHMFGGTISNCSGYQGGGVLLTHYSTMTMSGGRIEKCSAAYYGGGILAMNAPVIGPEPGGSSSSFTMTGGEIKNCSAERYGGGICIYSSNATALLNGGSIVGCSADIYGGGLANLYAKATVNGTAIHSNTAASAGDDIVYFANSTAELSISSVGDNWELNGCDHPIDSWYDDGTGSYRWNVHDPAQTPYTEKVVPGRYTTTIALKAAHGIGHTVTFVTQGGSEVDSQTVFSGTAVEPADPPTKDYYLFDGWYKNQLCTQAYDFSKSVTGDITLYAKWVSASPHYVLKYGDGRPDDGGDPYKFSYDPANPVDLPTEVKYFSQEEIGQLPPESIYGHTNTEGTYFLAWFGYMPAPGSAINTNYPVYEKTGENTYTEFSGTPDAGTTYYQFIPCETTPDKNLGDITYYAQW
ncbi:MAG: InlB B-repeat-containing protein, partial [Oscillospiraceae bacterium]|nr:InlB B-repeat-containing protein [Oscillospiraceae bacterium]